MSIASNSYASVADIEARVPQYTSSGSFGSGTKPTLTQVESFIDDVSSLVNALLAEAGFAIPVSQADAKRVLDLFVADEVAAMVEGVHRAGRFAPGSEELRGQSRFQVVMQDAAGFIEKHSEGLELLGATRSRSLTYGLDFRSEDASGDTILPFFGRKQFGNEMIDFDPE